MSVKIVAILRYLVFVGFLANISTSYALSISELQLHSKLNEKLDATIALSSVSPKDLENLKVGVIYDDSMGNIYRQPKIQIELVKQSDGKHYLRLQSQKPIIEPVVNFILELNWSTGRLNRQYQILIDPKLG